MDYTTSKELHDKILSIIKKEDAEGAIEEWEHGAYERITESITKMIDSEFYIID